MCGIFGYIGQKENAPATILNGLKTLEYRGYDSWGIAIGNGRTLDHEKHVGKISQARVSLPLSTFGIGHTRWATHGGVTDANAHPHLSCDAKIALVHNGIVENYQEIKKGLDKKHKIVSETDTEVITHLVEQELGSKDFKEAVAAAFKKLAGLNAIAVASSDGQLAVAKNGSPIVLGIGKGMSLISSDPSALLPYTQKVIFLDDGQLALLGGSGIAVFSLANLRNIKVHPQRLEWDFVEATTGKYPHFMIKEIFEQPKVIANCLTSLAKPAQELANEIKRDRGTFFIASGTA